MTQGREGEEVDHSQRVLADQLQVLLGHVEDAHLVGPCEELPRVHARRQLGQARRYEPADSETGRRHDGGRDSLGAQRGAHSPSRRRDHSAVLDGRHVREVGQV